MDNNVFFYPGNRPERNPNQEYVNGVPQPLPQNLQPQTPPKPVVPDGVHKARICSIEVQFPDDINDSDFTVATIFFGLEFQVDGQSVVENKVYNVTSVNARNVLCAELRVLGHEVEDREDFGKIRGCLLGTEVYVKVKTKEATDVEPSETGQKSYTFVPFDKGKKFGLVNPRINW